MLVGHDRLDADQPQALPVLTAAVTGVGEEQAAGVRAGEGEDALTLVLIGGPQVVAERRPVAIADDLTSGPTPSTCPASTMPSTLRRGAVQPSAMRAMIRYAKLRFRPRT